MSYLLNTLWFRVTANDFLTCPAVIAQATVANQTVRPTEADVDMTLRPASR